MEFFSEAKHRLIYIMRIPYETHRGYLKVGMATYEEGSWPPTQSALNKDAKKRIEQYTRTAGIPYDLLHAEIASFEKEGEVDSIDDYKVHDVLKRSGIEHKKFQWAEGANEWFICDLETAKRAIAAAKQGLKSLHPSQITHDQSPIDFRPEQDEAINKTLKRFKKGKQMLWNAKMRFGKTLSALETVKRWNNDIADDEKYKPMRRVLILTHRPVVDAGWFEDFGNIFYDTPTFAYGSKSNGDTFISLENRCRKGECRYVYFASMQDLRGSELVGGNFDKNDELFSTPWDLIIVDEAHEGTQTELGKNVLKELVKDETRVLKLSGTPFNLLDDYTEEEIYTWDYVMEQRAKANWDKLFPGDPNPYAGLPRLNIYTYDLGRLMNEYVDEDIAFNFREFFRTNQEGEFVHKKHVENFLNLLTKTDEESMYPFANERYRDIFRHTLWMVPGVKSAKALSTMLKNHPVFGNFEIVNVAGDGDEEESRDEALKKVEKAIGKDPDQTRTITLSCGRLTTGVSVKPWTGVFMLSGSFNTAASAYMQTIFRVQTPATINGKVKEDCYVFDFAPDRTLKVLAETAKISKKAGKQSSDDRKQLGEFLNFCPIISVEGSQMKQLDTEHMLQQLKKVYVERVVQSGFETDYLYNDIEFKNLTGEDINDFKELKGIIGQTKAMGKTNDVSVNNQGLTNEEYAELEKLEKKKKKELTEEEKAHLEELKKKQKVKQDAISILRGISIRMPLIIYGADITDEDKELTIDNFTQLVDSQSWEEFMPKGVSKQRFNAFKKYYDPDIFTAAAKRIRQMARAADNLTVEERIERIASIFATFRNPDKETVLTPWPVVNMHMNDTLGGYTFYNEDFSETIEEPRYVEQKDVTQDVFSTDSHLLEINSKSGLYPLYLAYNIYRSRLKNAMFSPETLEEHQAIWDAAVAENIFVICKTPMAKAITRRTLLGFRKGKTNMWAPDDLINKIKNQPELFIKKVHDLVGKDVKIKAIVGNPPYNENNGGGKSASSGASIYPLFIKLGFELNTTYCSMIVPSRWYSGGNNMMDNLRNLMAEGHIKTLIDYPNARDCFKNVEIKGGVSYFLYDKNYTGPTLIIISKGGKIFDISTRPLKESNFDVIIRYSKLCDIVKTLKPSIETSFKTLVSANDPYGFDEREEGSMKRKKPNLLKSPTDSSVYFYMNGWRKNGIAYVDRAQIKRNTNWVDLDKIFIPKSWGKGEMDSDRLSPFIPKLPSCSTETYLTIGPFNSKYELDAVNKYIMTKFFHALVFVSKNTQNSMQDEYRFVPLQDFTENSDIDWSKSVSEIDQQLYKKYGLDDSEIAFIESMIKPM